MQFSVRSIGLVTLGVAILCYLFMNTPARNPGPPEFVLVWMTLFVLAWVIPAASFGFDVLPTSRGVLRGAVIGVYLAFIAFIITIIMTPLYRLFW